MSSLPPIEGTIAGPPFTNTICGGMPRDSSGSISGAEWLAGDPGESSENSAIAELSSLMSSLGSLAAQAQSLPLSPPTLPGLPQNQGYLPQATDYTQFSDDSN